MDPKKPVILLHKLHQDYLLNTYKNIYRTTFKNYVLEQFIHNGIMKVHPNKELHLNHLKRREKVFPLRFSSLLRKRLQQLFCL